MSYFRILAGALCLLSCMVLSGTVNAGETEVTLEKNGTLAGTLLLPEGSGPFPTVLMHPGSGPTDRDGNQPMLYPNSLKLLAGALAERGIASLRIDKRGVAASTGAAKPIAELTIDIFSDDIAAWAEWLGGREEVSSVHLLGHSLGGLIVSITAKKNTPGSLILVCAAGRRYSDLIVAQLKASPQIPETLHAEIETIVGALEQGEQVEEVSSALTAIFHPSQQPYLISMFSFDPAQEIRTVLAPLMIVQGGRDIQITKPDFQRLKKARPDATALLLPRMTHVLKDADGTTRDDSIATYLNPDLPLAEGLADGIAGFITKAAK